LRRFWREKNYATEKKGAKKFRAEGNAFTNPSEPVFFSCFVLLSNDVVMSSYSVYPEKISGNAISNNLKEMKNGRTKPVIA
jgi:hypothetical protein